MPRCAQRVLRSLRVSLRGGEKALVGNSAYRRYLKTPDQTHFEIDEQRVAEDARYDGLYVLRTNTSLDPLAVMLRYRELLKVEDIFRTAKSILDTRADLSPDRRGHPRPRVLLVPGARVAQGARRPPRRRAHEAGVGCADPAARSPAGNRNRARRQALRIAHAGHR